MFARLIWACTATCLQWCSCSGWSRRWASSWLCYRWTAWACQADRPCLYTCRRLNTAASTCSAHSCWCTDSIGSLTSCSPDRCSSTLWICSSSPGRRLPGQCSPLLCWKYIYIYMFEIKLNVKCGVDEFGISFDMLSFQDKFCVCNKHN